MISFNKNFFLWTVLFCNYSVSSQQNVLAANTAINYMGAKTSSLKVPNIRKHRHKKAAVTIVYRCFIILHTKTGLKIVAKNGEKDAAMGSIFVDSHNPKVVVMKTNVFPAFDSQINEGQRFELLYTLMSSLLLTPDFVSNDRTTLVFPLQYSQLNNQDTYDLLDLFGITLSSDMINKVFSTPKVVSAQNQHYKMMPLAIPSKELIWFSVPLLPVLQAIGKQKKIY